MILDTIILENFGAYGGRQEAVLTPEDGKPVILFGGMNGGGKTTLLDAIQLAFYGPKARLSNRGRGYRDYLRDSIHRGSDPGEGASVTLHFRRVVEGEIRRFELQRYWRAGVKGIEETVRVLSDGKLDDVFTEHWDEIIETYLPSGIAHLFFFDGEQIKELAEGGHAAEILGTAVHSLLGLDLLDRLESDLKVFERRKKAEALDPEATQELHQARGELQQIESEQEKVAMQEGAFVNQAGRLGKEVQEKEEQFRAEGGDLYLRRKELEAELALLKARKATMEARLRELVAGPLPLLLVDSLLGEVEQQARRETEIRRARALQDALEVRDREVLAILEVENGAAEPIRKITRILAADRAQRIGLAKEPLILDAEDGLSARLAHLRAVMLPQAKEQARDLADKLAGLEEKIARLELEKDRVPTEDRIEVIQRELEAARGAHQAKLAELEAVRVRQEALRRQWVAVDARLDQLGEHDLKARFAEDDRQRMLKHSRRVRETLGRFRARVVRRHIASMEVLMLESFRKLLRKTELIAGLTINPETFEVTLVGRDGKVLPFDRLSAGERQLLATSLLWGLARASGRPVPTIIDTPLGRLDSSHRRHLIERYFPCASHQVILLSTDEEIVGPYYEALKPFISRTYLLNHDNGLGMTNLELGYFSENETTH
ncbi:MAG: DNA sulfur modification protein DndD [Candidatus Competibacteraceae bacterium]|nr:MAG: DNA sulfur modification protein DndD [Candidatus Competibacteraceae bacterium]